MPELRKDPVIGRWVIIATQRARRPGSLINAQRITFDDEIECPFCDFDKDIIYSAKNKQGGEVIVVPRYDPALEISGKFQRHGHGLYDVANGYGVHEVVVETLDHTANMADLSVEQIKLVIETYVQRFNELEKDKNIKFVFAFKNYGWAAGSRKINHSRSQIIASPVNPLNIKEKLIGAKHYYEYHERCLYCDLIRQEENAKSRVIAQTDHFLAIAPFASRFPFEMWIIPKNHHCDFAKGVVGQEEDLAKIMKNVLQKLKIGIDDPAYNYMVHTAPFRRVTTGGKWKTIEEDYHWHIELMPRLTQIAGFEKGSGFYICPVPPENMAEFLREVEI